MEKDRNDQAVTPVVGDFSWTYREVRRGVVSIIFVFSSGRICDAAAAVPRTPIKNRPTPS